MDAYTFCDETLSPGVELTARANNGPVVMVGRMGRGVRGGYIQLTARRAPDIVDGRVLRAEIIKSIEPRTQKPFYRLQKIMGEDMTEPAVLVHICTRVQQSFSRASGIVAIVAGTPQVLISGFGLYEDNKGRWEARLMVMCPGDVAKITYAIDQETRVFAVQMTVNGPEMMTWSEYNDHCEGMNSL